MVYKFCILSCKILWCCQNLSKSFVREICLVPGSSGEMLRERTPMRLVLKAQSQSPVLTLSTSVVLSPSCHSLSLTSDTFNSKIKPIIPMWLIVKLLLMFIVTDSYLSGYELRARYCERVMSVHFGEKLSLGGCDNKHTHGTGEDPGPQKGQVIHPQSHQPPAGGAGIGSQEHGTTEAVPPTSPRGELPP